MVVAWLFIFISSLFVTPGCFTNKVPIDTIYYRNHEEEKNHLFVFLHGRGGSARDFEDNGFVQEIRKEDLPVDMVSVEAPLGYYMNQSIVIRLRGDVIEQRPGQASNDVLTILRDMLKSDLLETGGTL